MKLIKLDGQTFVKDYMECSFPDCPRRIWFKLAPEIYHFIIPPDVLCSYHDPLRMSLCITPDFSYTVVE